MFRIMWQHTLKQQSYGLVQERAPWAAICQYSVEVSSFILHGGSPWIISWYFMHPIDFTFHTADPVQNRSLTRGWSQVLFEILYHVTRWRLDCDWRLFIWWQKLHEASPWPSNHGRLQGRLHACDATRTEARRSSLHPRMAPPSCFLPGHGFFSLGVLKFVCWNCPIYTRTHTHTHIYIYIYIHDNQAFARCLTYVYLFLFKSWHSRNGSPRGSAPPAVSAWAPLTPKRCSVEPTSRQTFRRRSGEMRGQRHGYGMAMGYGCFYQNHGIAGIASSNLGFPGVCSLFDDQ